MEYVKCVYNSYGFYPLTVNKIYKVISYDKNSINIIDELGENSSWFIESGEFKWFEDITIYYKREIKLNELL